MKGPIRRTAYSLVLIGLVDLVLGLSWFAALVMAAVFVVVTTVAGWAFERFFIVRDDPKPGSIHRRR